MEVLKRLAPKYWLGYYCVYVAVTVFCAFIFWDELSKWPKIESLFAAAAIFAVSTGAGLLSAIIMEGGGYLILLIPNRIKELKDAGRAEAQGRSAGRSQGSPRGSSESASGSPESAGGSPESPRGSPESAGRSPGRGARQRPSGRRRKSASGRARRREQARKSPASLP